MQRPPFIKPENQIQDSSIPQGNTPDPNRVLRFAEFQTRLVDCLRDKIRSGELTERGLARLTGISQPHVHNVLKGKKLFSIEVSDTILRELNLDLLDLVQPEDILRCHRLLGPRLLDRQVR
jgi:hypothetical protein